MQNVQIEIDALLLDWSTQYQVDDDFIDRQHQKMFELFNTLAVHFITPEGDKMILPAIEAFIGYTKQHFSDEEQLMDRINFRNRQEHKRRHAELLSEIDGVVAEMHEGKRLLSAGLLVFLREWILIHILSEDTQLKPHLA